MLVASTIGFGAVAAELLELQVRIADCFDRKQFDLAHGRRGMNAVIASGCSNGVLAALTAIETVTFIDRSDQALVVNLARLLLQQWRGMGEDGAIDDNEAAIRRIAAEKLTDHGFLAPDLAVQQLSTAGRLETDGLVLLRIIAGLTQLITKTTAANIATEALTTLDIIGVDPNDAVRISAQVARNIIRAKLAPTIEIGPAVVTPIPSSKPSNAGPIIAIAATAVVSAGVLWYVFGHRRRR
jgi:hypothetical protein